MSARTSMVAGLAVAALWATVPLAGGPAAALAQQPAAQQTPELTVERIYGSDDFSAESFDGRWRSEGVAWTVIEENEREQDELWRVDAATGERERLIAASELVPREGADPIAIEGVSFSDDGEKVLVFTDAQQVWRARTKGIFFVFDLLERTLTPLSREEGWQMFAKFSPDGERVAFVRGNDLFLTDLATGEERRLTSDGGEEIINGTTDWVYEEELSLRDGFRWSPDGRRIAYWRFDQSPIPPFYLVDETTLYPELKPVRYPKAGTENSRVRVGSLDLESGETTWFDTETDEESYLARMSWTSAEEVVVQRLNRTQNRVDLLRGDAETGETEVFLTETDSAWLDVNDDLTWLDDGERFLWTSERDGWRHIYLYARDGTLLRQLTSGEWPVTALHGVDESSGRVYFTAAREHPLTRSVGYVGLDGPDDSEEDLEATFLVGPAAEAGERGTHAAEFSPDFRWFFHTRSTFTEPPVTTLRRRDGSAVRTLVDNARLSASLDSVDLVAPEFTSVRAADTTPLHAYVLRPPAGANGSGARADRVRPLLLYVYGGPGSQTVLDRWGGARQLWHQMLARQGIVVASVDNRGTGARGRDFRKQVYLNLGEMETADQLAAARQLGELPYVDSTRIGIWGWSYGGYMTLMATLRGADLITAGVSVAPVTHWKYYDTIYTERYMRTPAANPDGYERSAPLNYADRLESELLLVHGTGDDNVHPQHTIRMVEELENADRQFAMRLYPNKRHAISGSAARVNLFHMITDFLRENLVSRPE